MYGSRLSLMGLSLPEVRRSRSPLAEGGTGAAGVGVGSSAPADRSSWPPPPPPPPPVTERPLRPVPTHHTAQPPVRRSTSTPPGTRPQSSQTTQQHTHGTPAVYGKNRVCTVVEAIQSMPIHFTGQEVASPRHNLKLYNCAMYRSLQE